MSRPTGALISGQIQPKKKKKKKCAETSLCVFRFSNVDSDDTTVVVVKLKSCGSVFTHQRQRWVRDVGGRRAHSLGGTFKILNLCFPLRLNVNIHSVFSTTCTKKIESLGKRKHSGVDLRGYCQIWTEE